MRRIIVALVTFAMALGWAFARPADASANLVSVEWLQKNMHDESVLLIDASSSRAYEAKHIPGAIGVDLYAYGSPQVTPAQMEKRIQSWGISPGRKVVLYDQGASMEATWLFYELHYHGYPASDLVILDGGLAKWQAAGGAVTKDATPAPKPGSFRVTRTNEDHRVRLAEFVTGSGDPSKHTLVEALEPAQHFGGTKFFDRAGHVPNAIMLPVADFFNADKTFKSPDQIATMAAYLGITPERQVYSHCGGGIAATVPYFALRFLSGYPNVKVYKESQLEWLQDERGLPFWTYDAPYLKRDGAWLNGWGSRMMRMYGVTQLSVIDIRPPDAYGQAHVPFALNVPAETFAQHLDDPRKLADLLGAAGVDPQHEAVILSSGGLNRSSALAFLVLEKLGQRKVSLLMDSTDDWGFKGFALTKEPTAVGAKKSPVDIAIPPTSFDVAPRNGVIVREAGASRGPFPKVFVASGMKVPANAPKGTVVHVPYSELVGADGAPKAAHEIWTTLVKAGVPRYAEIIAFSDDAAEAAVNYFIFRLMGYPDVKVLAM